MKRLLMCLMVAALGLAAQTADSKSPDRLVILKYADPQSVANLIKMFGASVSTNTEMHALAIRTDPDKWPVIEEAIRRLDVPSAVPRNYEITVYYVVAGKALQQGTPLPAEMEPVVTQLKRTFSFAEYRVLDTLMLRGRVGQVAEASGSIRGGGPAPIVTQVKLRAASADPDGKIHIDSLKAGMRLPTVIDNKGSYNYIDTGINTDIDVKDGQKVIVGKSSFEGPDKAVFLVLSARLLD